MIKLFPTGHHDGCYPYILRSTRRETAFSEYMSELIAALSNISSGLVDEFERQVEIQNCPWGETLYTLLEKKDVPGRWKIMADMKGVLFEISVRIAVPTALFDFYEPVTLRSGWQYALDSDASQTIRESGVSVRSGDVIDSIIMTDDYMAKNEDVVAKLHLLGCSGYPLSLVSIRDHSSLELLRLIDHNTVKYQGKINNLTDLNF